MEKRRTEQSGINSNGLSSAEAAARLDRFGENRLESAKRASAGAIFFSQFKDLLILILLASTVISVLMGEYVEALTIITIVFINAIVGFIQEYRTEKTLEALKKLAAPTATVLRDGRRQELPVLLVVPGDVILLESGDRIPADAKLVEAVSLLADESLLTGESVPVEKEPGQPVYMGTVLTKGRGRAVVTATGMETKMGGIAGLLTEIKEERTPLQEKLGSLGKIISLLCLVICAAVTVAGILRGEDLFTMFLTGLSLAVAAVPEGLPAIVTISLGLGVSRMLRRGALIRRLHAVETLGCSDIICSDKTGTLTENKMTVREIRTVRYRLSVTGTGYEKGGEFTADGERVAVQRTPELRRLAEIAVLCNNAELSGEREAMRNRTVNESAGTWAVSGEPTEIALAVMAAKAGLDRPSLERTYSRIGEIPFDSERKLMSVVVATPDGRKWLFTKGAPELLLARCSAVYSDGGAKPLSATERSEILRSGEEMAARALRVLAFAFKEVTGSAAPSETSLIFAGLAGLLDPPRREVPEAVARCKSAGIRPIMITGDSKITALAIARQLKIAGESESAMTGPEIDAMDDAALSRAVKRVSVFARVSPENKLRIVRALKSRGHIVAMTGDGVNDAPAVKEADIGVAMGKGGTDVTKEASSVVLLDDNFATLVCAVEEGRIIYRNIRKFIRYLLSCNIGEVITMFFGMLMGMPVTLVPIQILLVNLVTDSLPAIALGLEPGDSAIMRKKPRRRDESIFSGGLLSTILTRGCFIGLSTLAVFVWFLNNYGYDIPLARTAALATLIIAQLIHVFECKSEERSLFRIRLFDNIPLVLAVLFSFAVMMAAIYFPPMAVLFRTVPLSLPQFGAVMVGAVAVPILNGIVAAIQNRPRGAVEPDDIPYVKH